MNSGKQNRLNRKPALSCFEFRAKQDVSPFVLCGSRHDKHLPVLLGLVALAP